MSPGSAASGGVDVHFRLYQQSGSGSMERLLRRVALSGSALDKVRGTQGGNGVSPVHTIEARVACSSLCD